MSDSESHVTEFVNRTRIHDIEIIFSYWQLFWNLHFSNLFVYDMEFRIFEDEVIAELDGYDLIESVSLDNQIAVHVILDGIRSNIGYVDLGTRVLKSDFII